MKRIIGIVGGLVTSAALCFAGDMVVLQTYSPLNTGSTTNSQTSALVVGYVDSVFITNSSATAVTFTLSTPAGTIITGCVTNSFTYRPRLVDCTSAGVALSQYDRVFVYDQLLFTALQTTSNQTCTVKIRIDNPTSSP